MPRVWFKQAWGKESANNARFWSKVIYWDDFLELGGKTEIRTSWSAGKKKKRGLTNNESSISKQTHPT